ncbi:YtxH domain-containing protein [Gilliamella sp. wkB308]|uniref:YtxH domain-containing protein n=1 Tax=Gilliamella sp. wkB308 TaxID=3120263 RepID=UPI00080DC2A9|nr:YtxH domain-containing protein [Gilliamella apicola]OCG00628.1 hypothetical protein A9G10_03960 [Gilliamella apicola]
MKFFKVITLALLGIFLVNCDNSKSTVDDIKQKVQQTGADISDKTQDYFEQAKEESNDILNKLKEGNYNLAQDAVIKNIKQTLPLNIDQNTSLVDVSKENNTINYKYDVKGVTPDDLKIENTQKTLLNNLLTDYCSSDLMKKALRLAFPEGATHNYYINNSNALTLNLKPSDCDGKL